ncbi:MAG: sugar phosphate nucleotidyltransferase [Acutalibacteraceae bacterium]|nr:sugar phosphate nucleotidyltransferase [Acutalibacteraceae bacterium]
MKAVIMAGGEGRRLRPLTCTLPKPMAKILGKPIIEYIFDLLCAGGVKNAAVTLGYLPHIIEESYENGYKGLKLDFIKEDNPLGTAGSVRNAAKDFDEPFFVISGDALCNFDLNKIMAYHKASGAMVTVVAVDATDPREYGVVRVDKENRVTGFIEKPSWSQAVSNLANTGVYVISPECLGLIPKEKPYDFASDLFPLMLERGMPIYCYHTSDYWCDAGNIEAYLKCQRDAFDGRVKPLSGETAKGIYTGNRLPSGDYSIIPPVYIGKNTEISDGAVIGPYAVIGDGCSIGRNSKVRYSVVSDNCCFASDTSVTGALVCSGAALRSRSSMYENSVAGSGCVIGEDACIKPGISVWPGKVVGRGAAVNSNIKYGNVKAEYFSGGRVSEGCGIRLNAENCVRLGASMGSVLESRKIAMACDGTPYSRIMCRALAAGIGETGAAVWDFGECFESQFKYLVNVCGIESGVFACGNNERYIEICSYGGLSLPGRIERQLETAMSKCEFREASDTEIEEPSDMSGVKHLYAQAVMASAPDGLTGTSVFECENPAIMNFISCFITKSAAEDKGNTVFRISNDGTKLTAVYDGRNYCYEKLLAVACNDELSKGKDVAVPYDSPEFFDLFAAKYGRRVYRYLSTPVDGADSKARQLAAKQPFVRDGIFLAMKLLSVMKERNCGLDKLISELPERHIVRKTVKINFSPSYLFDLAGEMTAETGNNREGIKIIRNNGSLLVIPERDGTSVRMLAESDTAETAEEICAGFEEIINNANDKV